MLLHFRVSRREGYLDLMENGTGRGAERKTPISKEGVAHDDLSLRLAHLKFLGQGLARLAHDLKNHLATINESAGLMVDLLKLEQRQRFGWLGRLFRRGQTPSPDMAPVFSDLKRIEKEVIQGAILIQHLGRFAHRLEETRSVFDGDEALEEMRCILLEQAKIKGIHLEMRLSESMPMIETDPSGFQMIVLCNVEKFMAGLENGRRVILETAIREGLFQVCLSSPYSGYLPRFGSEEHCDEGVCRKGVEALGGQIWNQSGHGNYAVTLAFPLVRGKT